MTSLPYENESAQQRIEDLLAQGPWMRAFCSRLVGPSDADDLVQDTWLAALRRPPRGQGNMRSWLAAVARNLAQDDRRRRVRRAKREERAARDEAQWGEDVLARTELAHVVAGEMLALREPFRTTLVLRFVEGLSCRVIASRLGVAEPTVRTRIARGLEEVRQRLDARHGGDRQRWLAALGPLAERPTNPALVACAGVALAAGGLWFASVQGGSGVDHPGLLAAAAQEPAPALQPPVDPEVAPAQQPDEPLRRAIAPEPEIEVTATPARALIAPEVLWHHPRGQHVPPLVIDERVISISSTLACLDAHDGSTIWERPRSGRIGWFGPPVHVGELLIAAHGTGGVAAFRLSDGELVWSRSVEELDTTAHVGCRAPHEDGALYVAPTGSGLVALRARDGKEVWRTSLGGKVELTPAASGQVVLAGTTGGTFAAVRAADGQIAWREEIGGQFGWTPPVAHDGVVYVGDRGIGGSARGIDNGRLVSEVTGNRAGAVHAFRIENGEHLWGRIFGATGLADPFIEERVDDEGNRQKRVWLGFGTVCMALDHEKGEVQIGTITRTGRNPFGTPRVLGDQLVFGNLDGHLYAHDLKSRELLWALSVEGKPQVGGWTAAHGRIYVSTGGGLLCLADPEGATALERGTRLTFEPEPEPVAANEDQDEPTPAPVFVSSYELSSRWLKDLAPSRLTENEREQLGLPELKRGEKDTTVIDDARRSESLANLRAAIEGTELTQRLAALRTVARCQGVQGIDELRSPVRAIAADGRPTERYDALRSLRAMGAEPGDLELAHAAWDVVSAEQRLQLPYLLVALDEGHLRGRSAELVMQLLDGIDAASFRQMASSLWGSRMEDTVLARVLEFATLPQHASKRKDAIYYVLSTLKDKQDTVLDVLLQASQGEDLESAERALWGLGHGVPQERQAWVVDQVLTLMPKVHPYLADRAKRVVEQYGSEAQKALLPR